MAEQDTKWYYNPASGEVSQGRVGSWDQRMGPYETEAEARDAIKIAAERNEAFDDADAAWEGDN